MCNGLYLCHLKLKHNTAILLLPNVTYFLLYLMGHSRRNPYLPHRENFGHPGKKGGEMFEKYSKGRHVIVSLPNGLHFVKSCSVVRCTDQFRRSIIRWAIIRIFVFCPITFF